MCSAGRNEEALECALTYLLFHEGEEFMTENVEYYKEVLGHDSQPRKVRHGVQQAGKKSKTGYYVLKRTVLRLTCLNNHPHPRNQRENTIVNGPRSMIAFLFILDIFI